MKMRPLIVVRPPIGRPVFDGEAEWIIVVRHSLWGFHWDMTYLRVNTAMDDEGMFGMHWETYKHQRVTQRVCDFLNMVLDFERKPESAK